MRVSAQLVERRHDDPTDARWNRAFGNDRFFTVNTQWYYLARRVSYGPFDSREVAALDCMHRFIRRVWAA
jgi:hypothetical protein